MEVSLAMSTARVSGGGAAEQGLGGMLGGIAGPTTASLHGTSSTKSRHRDCRVRASRHRDCARTATSVAGTFGPKAGGQGGLGSTTGLMHSLTAVTGFGPTSLSGDLQDRGWEPGKGVGTGGHVPQTCVLVIGRKGRLNVGRLAGSRSPVQGQTSVSHSHTSALQSRPVVRASGLPSHGPYGPLGLHQWRTRPHAWGSSLVNGPTMSGGTKRGTPSSPAEDQPESANQLQSEFWQQQREQQQQQQQQLQQQQQQQQQQQLQQRQQQEVQGVYQNGSSSAEEEAVAQGLLTAANGVEGAMAALANAVDRNRAAAEAQGEAPVPVESTDGVPVMLNGVDSLQGALNSVPEAAEQEGTQTAAPAPAAAPAVGAAGGGPGAREGSVGLTEGVEGEQQNQKLVLLQQQVERIEQEAQILLQQSLSMKELLGMQQLPIEQNQVASGASGDVNQQPQPSGQPEQAQQLEQQFQQPGAQQPLEAQGTLATEPPLQQFETAPAVPAPAVAGLQELQEPASNEALQAQAQSRLELLAQEQAQVLEQAQALEQVQQQQVQEQEQLLEQVQQLVQEQAALQAQEMANIQALAKMQEVVQAQELAQMQELAQIRGLAQAQQEGWQPDAPAAASLDPTAMQHEQVEQERGEHEQQELGQQLTAEQQSLLQQPFPVGLVDTKVEEGPAHPGAEASAFPEAQGQGLAEAEAPMNGAALQFGGEGDGFLQPEDSSSLERFGEGEGEGVLSEAGGSSGVEQQQRQLQLRVGVASVPHPVKMSRGGEDAHLVEGTWLGVADGISAWSEQGVNSGLFSRELLWNCVDVIRSSWELLGVWPHPKAVIEESHSRTDLRGSCTVTLAAVEGQTLKVANIGDSGFVLVRGGELAGESERMEHGLNDPFQIGCNFGDDPSCAMVYETPVQPGDVILLATDGLFDNVYTKEIVYVLAAEAAEDRDPELVAKKLAAIAHRYGESETGDTPYADLAKAAGVPYEGGRREDVTVIVAYVEDPDDF